MKVVLPAVAIGIALAWLGPIELPRTPAKAEECLVDAASVRASQEDLQRVRVELEAHTQLLKDIRDALRRIK